MNLSDANPVRGDLDIRVFRNGVEIGRYRDSNMIMSLARDALARLVGGEGGGKTVTAFGVGENGDGPNPDDAALTGGYVKDVSGVSYPVTGSVAFAFSLTTAEANGMAIREFGLLCGDGTLFARKTRGAIEKADDIEITGTWTISF